LQDATNRPGKTLHFYGIGNHPASGKHSPVERLGILNATQYQNLKWYGFDNPNFWGKDGYFVWMPPHYKLQIGRHDETNQRAHQFGIESHEFFSRNGAVTFNTFDMTRELAHFFSRSRRGSKVQYYARETCKPVFDTWDGYHYSRTINVWKAHLALHRFMLSRDMVDKSTSI
jgi:hypothetical protein